MVPTMSNEQTDVMVLGSGIVGQTVAYKAKKAGRSVVVVETREPGGTCPNRGCDAKKPLVNAAHALRHFQALHGKGLAGEVRIDWPALIRFKRSFTDPVGPETAQDLREAGVTLVQARPRFVDEQTIEAGGTRYQAKQIVIATGKRPRELDIPGAEHTINSDGFLELDKLPKRVAFVGGGYIAMEFAGVAAAAGAEVTVIEAGVYPLGKFEEDAVRVLLRAFEEQGIRLLTRRKVTAVERRDDGALQVVTDADEPTVVADLVVNTSGRVASLDGMDLEAGKVERVKAGVKVDEYLRSTSNPRVWAGGDVAASGRPPLTPTASQDGRTLAHNLLHDEPRTGMQNPVATVAFTTPPVAAVGFTEADAREQHGGVEVISGDLAEWKVYKEHGHQHGYYKLIFAPDNGPLIGAHLTGYGADEVINFLSLGICRGVNRDELCSVALAYPTLGFSLDGVLQKR